jgi:hypothetical protein
MKGVEDLEKEGDDLRMFGCAAGELALGLCASVLEEGCGWWGRGKGGEVATNLGISARFAHS